MTTGAGPVWAATLLANGLGAAAMGVCARRLGESMNARVSMTWHFWVTGFLGGFTTFSSFSLQTVNLLRDGAVASAAAYVAGSAVLCVLAAWLGHLAALALQR